MPESVNLFRDKPIGTLRLAVSRSSATRRLAPLIQPILTDTAIDIVSGRFDAGIRVDQRVEHDMTVVWLADDFGMLAIATPAYPASPRSVV